ncbi:MAG: methyltransferase domain-containing protein [Chloroflexi bacterium]|nr:methyltransferase domain-containing protein [Chloroflexota bacterium]
MPSGERAPSGGAPPPCGAASLRTGFGLAAKSYDAEAMSNPSMRHMREMSLAALLDSFGAGDSVLDIGCGTGEEALALAARGVHVLATDLAPEMVALTERKAREVGLADRVATRVLAASELGQLVETLGNGALDGAYSSFGPLNGERDLRPVAEALASLIRPGGRVVVSVMNRYYALETVWFLLHGQPRHALRRWSGYSEASVSPQFATKVPTWYVTPGAFVRAFRPWFRPERCRALPLLLPPPYLAGLWESHPKLWQRLKPLERSLAGRWPFRALGDHFLMILRRV